MKCQFGLSKNDIVNSLRVPSKGTLQLTNVEEQLNFTLASFGVCIVGLVCCGIFSNFPYFQKSKEKV